MSTAESDLDLLAEAAESVELHQEAGQEYILLRGAKLPAGCNPQRTDLLLRTTADGDGYGSKLLFPPDVKATLPTSQGAGWQGNTSILGRTWTWYSWKVPDDPPMSILQRLLVHLRPVGA